MNFTLISHKPDSDDYCKGCLMATYTGNLEVFGCIAKEKLISSIIEYKTRELQYNETGYTFIVTTIINEELVTFDDFIDSTNNYSNSGNDYSLYYCIKSIIDEINKGIKSVEEKRVLELKEAKEKQNKAFEKAREAAELQEFKRLKAKFVK